MPQAAPLLNAFASVRFPNSLDQAPHLLRRLPRIRRPTKKLSHRLLLLLRVGGEIADGEGFAVEEIGHEDTVLVFRVGVREDIGALHGLREEAEDVVDYEEGGGGVGGARCV